MQKLTVNFYQRVMLWQMIGGHPTKSIKEASVHLRVIEKIRLTDKEMLTSQFFQENERSTWKLPDINYGVKNLELETDEAKALIETLEAPAPVRVSDAQWMLKLVDELNAGLPSAVPASEQTIEANA